MLNSFMTTRSLSYRKQPISLLFKSVDWFLYIETFVMKELKHAIAHDIQIIIYYKYLL